MPSQNDHKTANLWLGFALGSISIGLLAYFFGTKKGRQTLKKILDLTENLEENIETIAAEVEKLMSEKSEEIKKDLSVEISKDKPFIGNLLDKMKILVPHSEENQQKKFFVREKN